MTIIVVYKTIKHVQYDKANSGVWLANRRLQILFVCGMIGDGGILFPVTQLIEANVILRSHIISL